MVMGKMVGTVPKGQYYLMTAQDGKLKRMLSVF